MKQRALPAIRSLNEALIRSRKSRENLIARIKSSGSFFHSEGQSPRFLPIRAESAFPPSTQHRENCLNLARGSGD